MRERRPSMADVARRSGVSGQTVSRVVNGHDNVDPVTRDRVLAAMEAVGYRPHRAAQALRTGRSHSVGVVVATLESVGNSRMVEAVALAAAARGQSVVLETIDPSAADPLADAAWSLVEQGVDGAIVVNEAAPYVADDVPGGLRLVLVDAPEGSPHDVVLSDHRGGARELVTRLLDAGASTVHHVAGPANSFAAAERRRGWQDALRAAGRDVPPPIVGDWTSRSGREAGAVLAAATDVSAVFAANDQMALGVMYALHEAGRAIPGAVAVAGFDGIVDGAQFWPALTTVAQDFDALAAAAVELLLAGPGGAQRRVVVPTSQAPRASTRG